MKKIWANLALAATLVTTVSGCTIVDETASPANQSPTVTPESMPTGSGYPEAPGRVDTNLVVTVLEGNGMPVTTRRLSCSGTQAVQPTTLRDGNEACEVVSASQETLGIELLPTDDKSCRDTGNQIVADVIGESQGQNIMVTFMRNNLCNAKIWDEMTPLLGVS